MSLRCFAAVALSIGLATPTFAHEFDAAVVAPFTEDGEIGQAILRGLVFAASERDSHSGMTSDGHLGGVDVHFKVIDSAEGLSAARDELTAYDAPIVFLAASDDWQTVLADELPGAAVFVAGQQPAADNEAVQDTARRFLAATGAEMSAPARAGYSAGRRIDQAVRPLDGAVPTQSLREAFAQSAGGFDWAADFLERRPSPSNSKYRRLKTAPKGRSTTAISSLQEAP